MESLVDLRVADLLTFLAVHRTRSITAAARELRVTPSQVSKAMTRLEAHWGRRVLTRTGRGVSLTEHGLALVDQVTSVITALRAMRSDASDKGGFHFTVAGPSYLVAALMPNIATSYPRLCVRALELAPPHLRAYMAENIFDVALILGPLERRPPSWTCDEVGSVRVGLLTSPAVASRLGAQPVDVERLRDVRFVAPTVAPSDRFVPLNDACPLPRNERVIGHETQSIGAALEFAARTDHVVFGPIIAAQRWIAAGALVEIAVRGWHVEDPLYMACNGNTVLAPVRTAMLGALRSVLAN